MKYSGTYETAAQICFSYLKKNPPMSRTFEPMGKTAHKLGTTYMYMIRSVETNQIDSRQTTPHGQRRHQFCVLCWEYSTFTCHTGYNRITTLDGVGVGFFSHENAHNFNFIINATYEKSSFCAYVEKPNWTEDVFAQRAHSNLEFIWRCPFGGAGYPKRSTHIMSVGRHPTQNIVYYAAKRPDILCHSTFSIGKVPFHAKRISFCCSTMSHPSAHILLAAGI